MEGSKIPTMVRKVRGWYEKSVIRMVRKIQGWNEKSMVRIVHGTKSLVPVRITSVGWQVTLCDPIWQAVSRAH